MAATIRFDWNSDGFREILTSDEVRDLIDGKAREMTNEAGEGYEYKTQMMGYGGGRWGAFVYTGNGKAMLDQAQNHTLERVMH